MGGSLAFTVSTLTISAGSVTAKRAHHIIAAQTGTTDDLANITTGSVSDGAIMVIRADSGDTITVKDAATGAGEIHLDNNADYVMSGDLSLTLQFRTTDWYEIARDARVDDNIVLQVVNTETGAVATGPGARRPTLARWPARSPRRPKRVGASARPRHWSPCPI